MSNNDRVSELYLGQIFSEANQLICRRRINWMCSQATGRDVLDVGCSQGIASILLAREGFTVTGIDVEEAAIHFAGKLLAGEPESVQKAVTFLRTDGAAMPFGDASFDSVLMGEVIEHLVHPERVLAEITRVLKPGGRLVLTTPLGLHVYHDHKRPYYPTDFTDLLERFVAIESISFMDKYQWCIATKGKPAESFWARLAEVRELLAGFESEMLRFEESAHVQQEEAKTRAQKQAETLEKERAAHRQAQEDLARAVTEHDKQVMSARAETQAEHERWVAAAADLRERCECLKETEDICAGLRANLADSRERAATAEGRVQGLEVELARQLDERSHERAAAASASAAAAAAAEHRFESQGLELEQARIALQTAQATHTQRMAALESSIQRALDVAAAERKDAETLVASTHAVAQARITTLTAELACSMKNSENLEKEITRNAELRGELRIVRLASGRLQIALNKAREALAAARASAAMAEGRTRGLESDVTRLMNELDRERKQAAEQRNTLQESYEKRLVTLSDELSRVREAATAERTAAQARQISDQEQTVNLSDELARVRETAAAACAAAQAQQSVAQERIAALNDELARICDSSVSARADAHSQQVSAQERIGVLSEELARAREALDTERVAAHSQQVSAEARILALNDALAGAREAAANEKAAQERTIAKVRAELREALDVAAKDRETIAGFEAQERQMRESIVMHIDGELATLREMERMQDTCRDQVVQIREVEGRLARAEAGRENIAARLDAIHRSKLGALTLKYWSWRARLRRYVARRKGITS